MPSRLETIADPVRLRIVRHLEAHGPAQLADLAAGAGVHLNTARTHAAALEADGVIVREPGEPSGRGRPPLSYRLSDDWALPTSDLHGLAEIGEPDESPTRARVSWTLAGRLAQTRVLLKAEIEQAQPLDRLLLALGGRAWLRRSFDRTLERLARRFEAGAVQAPVGSGLHDDPAGATLE